LSNTAWAFATIRVLNSEPLLDAIASEAMPRVTDYLPQDLACTAWSFARFEFPNVPLLNAIAESSIPTMPHFSIRSLANMSWAVAKLLFVHEPLS